MREGPDVQGKVQEYMGASRLTIEGPSLVRQDPPSYAGPIIYELSQLCTVGSNFVCQVQVKRTHLCIKCVYLCVHHLNLDK